MKPDLDNFLSKLKHRLSSKDVVAGCDEYADLLTGDDGQARDVLASLDSAKGCSFSDKDAASEYLVTAGKSFFQEATKLCGPGLAARMAASRRLADFTDIIENTKAGVAARRIGDRMELFAPNIELRNCLESAGIGSEPAVMEQPFNQIVAACEVMLGLPAQTPRERWPVPSVSAVPRASYAPGSDEDAAFTAPDFEKTMSAEALSAEQRMPPATRQLVLRELREDYHCRGGGGGVAAIQKSCEARDRLSGRIEKLGYCWGLPDDMGYDRYWRPCSDASADNDEVQSQ